MEKKRIKKTIAGIMAGIVVLCALLYIAFVVVQRSVPPGSNTTAEIHPNSLCPVLSNNKQQTDEERIAKHFAADTLPWLMKKGIIKKYQRTASGTLIAVNGNLWNNRSPYFKHCLLKEVLVYNTFSAYAVSTQIVDSTSGKLYAQIAASAKMDFYD